MSDYDGVLINLVKSDEIRTNSARISRMKNEK